MIVDTSAVMAILLGEPTAAELAHEILTCEGRARMSAPTRVETAVVAHRRLALGAEPLIAELDIETVPFTQEHSEVAAEAYRRFGKGSGSPARLNLGDTYSYALARVTGAPLLYVGDDFTHTDVVPALPA